MTMKTGHIYQHRRLSKDSRDYRLTVAGVAMSLKMTIWGNNSSLK